MRYSSGNVSRHNCSLSFAILVLAMALLTLGTACGGSSSATSTTGTVAITISPLAPTIPVTSSLQFSASITNSTNTSVTWQVNGTTGGSATYGTISTSGLYTAPSAVPTGTITVTATSQADTSKTVSTSVTVTSANTLVVSPVQLTIAAGGQQTFAATLGGAVVSASWSLYCSDLTAGACGTMQSNGVYTAPLAPPPGQTVTITAKSSSNVANPANANVIVTFGPGSLVGNYSFAVTGSASGVPFTAVGSAALDGKGAITGGSIDLPGQATPLAITGGSYTCDAEGRVAATIQTTAGNQGWQVTLVNHKRAFVTRVDGAIARGEIELQDSSKFGRKLVGSLSLRLAGSSGGAVAASGEVGALTFDASGNITSGVLDVNDGGTIAASLAPSGAATASSATTGRGTLSLASTFGAQSFAYYLIDEYTANLVQIDGSHDFAGKVVWRSPAAAIDTSYYLGAYGFLFTGSNTSGLLAQGGTFNIDSNGAISNGVFDTSSDAAYALGYLLSGTLTVTNAASGRATATFNVGGTTLHYVVYPPDADARLTFLQVDSNSVVTGPAISSSTAASGSSVPSISGHFAMQAAQTSGSHAGALTGALLLAGSAAPSGWLDLVENGSVSLNTAVQNSSFGFTSLYGRGAMFLKAGAYSAAYRIYLVDGDAVLLMQTDGAGLHTGIARKRY